MPLNRDCIGKTYSPVTATVDLEAAQRYARAYNDDNPAFFAPSQTGGILAPPMFGVAATWGAIVQAMTDPELGVDFLHLLHSAQDIEFISPLKPGDQLIAAARIVAIEPTLGGESLVLELDARRADGEPVQRQVFTAFIRNPARRSERGGASIRSQEKSPDAPPIATVEQTIDADQTYRYAEASGDHNPIHLDETVARMAGLKGIIVHGLCTMAFVSKAVMDRLCQRDPRRLKRLYARFSRPVYPNQTITTLFWAVGSRDGRQIYGYETRNPEGRAVIREGVAEVAT